MYFALSANTRPFKSHRPFYITSSSIESQYEEVRKFAINMYRYIQYSQRKFCVVILSIHFQVIFRLSLIFEMRIFLIVCIKCPFGIFCIEIRFLFFVPLILSVLSACFSFKFLYMLLCSFPRSSVWYSSSTFVLKRDIGIELYTSDYYVATRI